MFTRLNNRALRAACACVLACGVGGAWAQAWPAKPVRMVVGQGPGSGVDLVARKVAEKLTAALGVSFYVDNKPGANGIIGADLVAKAAPDGYTVLVAVPSTTSINQFTYASIPYDPQRDFAAVTQTHGIAFGLVVKSTTPLHTVAEVLKANAAKPGGLNYSSGGIGNLSHLAAELFCANAKVKMQHVPNKGEGPAMLDLVGGQTDVMFSTLPTAAQLIQSGQLRLIATMGRTRASAFPNVPNMVELGYPNVVVEGWGGLVVPKGTPAAIIDRLYTETAKGLQAGDLRKAIIDQGGDPVGSRPADFARFMQDETKKWQRVIAEAGIKPQQ